MRAESLQLFSGMQLPSATMGNIGTNEQRAFLVMSQIPFSIAVAIARITAPKRLPVSLPGSDSFLL